MAHGILRAYCFSGFSGDHDPTKGKNRDSIGLRNPTPACWTPLCDKPTISVLFVKKENFDLEQKKATTRVASYILIKRG